MALNIGLHVTFDSNTQGQKGIEKKAGEVNSAFHGSIHVLYDFTSVFEDRNI
jgi:hypothetical protein